MTVARASAYAAGTLAACAVAFVAGRRSAPVRVEERTVTQVQRVVEYKDRVVAQKVAGPVRIVTRTVEKPGAERVVERVVERGAVTTTTTTDRQGTSTDTSKTTAEKLTSAGQPGWRVAVSPGWDLRDLTDARPRTWGGEVDRRVLGPVWLGAWARSDKTGGLSVGFQW